MRWLCLRLAALVFFGIALSGSATAHPMPNSLLQLDIHQDRVDVDLTVPIVELALALRLDMAEDPATLVRENAATLGDYFKAHIRAASPERARWTVEIGALGVDAGNAGRGIYSELVTHLVMRPPPGATSRTFVLDYDAVLERVKTHFALVSVRRDWMTGTLGVESAQPMQVGVIRVDPVTGTVPPLRVALSSGSLWTGFSSMFALGVAHLAEGTDHLLFLLTLLLPAPLLVRAGRWAGYAGARSSLSKSAGIVTAFTIGHSLTLIIASLLRLEIPQQPIEVLIALTILVSSVHAIRPLFGGREAVVAGVFGLIHGMAFSFTLAEMNLSGTEMALSLAGFNLGIEAVQLLIVIAVMPLLVVMAQTRAYTALRLAGGGVAAIAAAGWAADRLGFSSPVGQIADALGPAAPYLMIALAATAGGVLGWRQIDRARRKQRRAGAAAERSASLP